MSETLANIVKSNDRGTPTAALHVEVIADLACPFCFLGKRRLDSALTSVQGPSDISWYPWQLNPELPKEGEAYTDFLTQRFGSIENIQPILDGLVAEGAKEGIDFRFDKLERVPWQPDPRYADAPHKSRPVNSVLDTRAKQMGRWS